MTEKYNITGMNCSACSARVQKAVASLDGVNECSVNLLTNTMLVSGTASVNSVIDAVVKAGYGASLAERNGKKIKDTMIPEKNLESVLLKRRFIVSLCILLPLLYLSAGHMIALPLPAFGVKNPVSVGLMELILTVIITVINRSFFLKGYKALFKLSPTMDTLVALSATAAFIYSAVVLGFNFVKFGNDLPVNNLYFDSAAMILTVITLGKMLESKAKRKTVSALEELMDMAPKKAVVIRNGVECIIPAEDVIIGDIALVRPGETVPVDGIVIEGETDIDESAITGESVPCAKNSGSKVFGATQNLSGFIKIQVANVGNDTAIGKIIQTVNDASASKAPIAEIADKVSGIFVPVVMCIATVTFIIWLLVGAGIGYALARGISVLIISCPCALGLATPVAVMVGSGVGAKKGILYKTAVALEEAGKISIAVFDKTGTVTKGFPTVTDVIPAEGITEEAFIGDVAALEYKSEHPFARAIKEYAEKKRIKIVDSEQFTVMSGNGVSAMVNGRRISGGSLKYISEQIQLDLDVIKMAERLSEAGKTPLFFCSDGNYIGMIAVLDIAKEDAAPAISELKAMGVRVLMLTGDNSQTAAAVAAEVGIDEVIAGVLPAEKNGVINRLRAKGKTMMVGDGINDAPALIAADIGVAIGAGTDVAVNSADIVLTGCGLYDAVNAVKLSRATLRNIKENLCWAFMYNIVGIPLAAGVFIPFFGWELNPMFGALAMSFSSVLVVSNALRLNFTKSVDGNKIDIKEKKGMKLTMKIEGMMCPHCEANVKNALEAIAAVTDAEVSFRTGTAIVTLSEALNTELLKQTVENRGYTVTGIGE